MKFSSLFIASIAPIIFSVTSVNAQIYCVEEFNEKRQNAALNFLPLPKGEWDERVKIVEKSLDAPSNVVAIPCNHGKKVISFVPTGAELQKIANKEYIIYDTDWITEVIGDDEDQVNFVIGHEIGHFVSRHYGGRGESLSSKEKELEADGYGACAVAKMNGEWPPLEDLITRIRTSETAGYPTVEESLEKATEEFQKCGGTINPQCLEDDWDVDCPVGVSRWTVDLYIYIAEYFPNKVTYNTLEVRHNNTNLPIARLRPLTFQIFGEPKELSIEVRTISKFQIPDNFGLVSHESFDQLPVSSKNLLLSELVDHFDNNLGTRQGKFVYVTSAETGVSSSSHKVAATISSVDTVSWGVNTRVDDFSSPLPPGDSLIISTSFSLNIDPAEFYSSVSPERLGATSFFPVRNSFFVIDADNAIKEISSISTNSNVDLIDGTSDVEKFEKIKEISSTQSLLYYKGLPIDAGVKIEFSWAE